MTHERWGEGGQHHLKISAWVRLGLLWFTWVHLCSQGCNSVYLGSPQFTLAHLGSLGFNGAQFGSLWFTWVHLGSLGFTLDQLGLLAFTWVHLGSFGFTLYHFGSLNFTYRPCVSCFTVERCDNLVQDGQVMQDASGLQQKKLWCQRHHCWWWLGLLVEDAF